MYNVTYAATSQQKGKDKDISGVEMGSRISTKRFSRYQIVHNLPIVCTSVEFQHV